MAGWDETRDFVAIGSGGGAMTSSLYLRDIGKDVLVLEKTDMVGGSTAMSGGVLWIPNHPLQAKAGVKDSYEAAMTYIAAVVGDVGPASSPARRHAYVATGPRLMQFLMDKGIKLMRAEGWSDYYDDLPGGCPRGRSIVPALFDLKQLGKWNPLLRRSPLSLLPVYTTEGVKMMVAKRSLAGTIVTARVALRMMLAKLLGQELRSAGMALQGRMLQAVLRDGAEIRLNAPVADLIEEGGRVAGVLTEKDGKPWRIRARDGVLINAGGFAHNQDMRTRHLPAPATTEWTLANPGDTGEMINIAVAHGAATDLMDATIWVPVTWPPGAERPKIALTGLSKPYLIVVNKEGRRFARESLSYMEFGQRMHANNAVPAWMIFDHQHRSDYPLGMTPPGITPSEWIRSGWLKRADTVEQLAAMISVEPAVLKATIDRYNEGARRGVDPDFHRGERAYDRFFGDHTHKPNPSVGPIEKPPFYAVELLPSDVGTTGGILTDENGRVLRQDGSAITGLYAAGNCTASVMGRAYLGAGASIGSSFIFGYRAAQHAAGRTPND